MVTIRRILGGTWFCLMLTGLGCAASHTLPVSFTVSRPPLSGTATSGTLACFGFTGDDPIAGSRLEARFVQEIKGLGRYTLIPSIDILAELKNHAHKAGILPDSLAVAVGRRLHADIIVLGRLTRSFTEQYQEEKKYQTVVVTDQREKKNLLYQHAYWEAFVNQTATLSGTIRAISTATGKEIGSETATHSATIKIMLRSQVKDVPKTPQTVERVDPRVLNAAAAGLAKQFAASFDRHAVSITRQLVRGDRGSQEGIQAARHGDWNRALATWERAVRETPKDPDAWNNLAIAYEQAGRMRDARDAYDRAITLRPDDRRIRRNLEGSLSSP